MTGYVYLRYCDLFDERSRLITLKQKLRQFKLSNIIFTLARISLLLGRQGMLREGKDNQRQLQELLISNYIGPELLEGNLKPRFGHFGADERPIFFRQQILNLLRMCVLLCREDAPMTTEGKSRGGYELGQCCLMMNDHLVSPKEEQATGEGSDKKRRMHIGLQLAPNIELNNPPQAARAVVRAESLFSEILFSDDMKAKIATIDQKRGFDLAEAFREATGLKIDEYTEFVLTMTSVLFSRTQKEIVENANLLLFRRSELIKGTRIVADDFDRYLALDCMTLAEAKARFNEPQKKLLPQFDYVWFRTWPLLQLEDEVMVCVDPCFMVEKLSSGIYWTIVNSLKGKKRDNALTAFGYLFETYVSRILQQVSPPIGMFIDDPKYTNGERAFDGIIHCGDQLIVTECKASFMTIEAKYGGRVRGFNNELDKKFGTGRGVVQLVNHIERLFARKPSDRYRICELDRVSESSHSRIEKITPVLIVQESLLRFSAIEEMLSDRFVRLLKQRRISHAVQIAPLAVIDIDTLEQMKPHLVAGDFTLQQCLNARAVRDPGYRSGSWHDFLIESFPQYATKADVQINEKFEAIMDRGTRNIFGDQPQRNLAGATL
ncbi:MAG: hypothetical protein QOF62_1701 [Pyrinomonadaceae bacterium]|jgi:hypothetical protein|nr:hypothetical protein [Pyrinomonadaceae bacterium]